ncbi:hypothetical protein TNCV_1560581 [Trichonephila clavipes]|nr:hypothetical protein TNCV_1560581 [Trichonephila clavipes]
MFVFSVVLSVINLFCGRQRNMSSNTRCSGLSRQRGLFNVSYGQHVLQDLNPIENVWDALERQVSGRNYPPTNKNTSSVHSQRNGINCLNSCWIMLCKV